MIKAEDYLWYPFHKYLNECKKKNKESSINEYLLSKGKVFVFTKQVKDTNNENAM